MEYLDLLERPDHLDHFCLHLYVYITVVVC